MQEICAKLTLIMKRLFVAMHVADSTAAKLLAVQAELKGLPPGAAEKIRPVARQALHLTLKFLGETDDDRVAALTQALQVVAGRTRVIEAHVSGVSAFPDPRRPRAVFAALTAGASNVTALAEEIEVVCDDLGFPAENRPRVPHVTLARVDNARPGSELSAWIADHAGVDFGPVAGDRIVLYESRMHPGGSLYMALTAPMLQGATP